MTDRIALFIDGANLHRAARSLGFEIDYQRLLHEFSRSDIIVRAFFYTTLTEGQSDVVRPLTDWLNYNGFTVRAKQAKEYDDQDRRRRTTRHIYIDLAIDALDIARRVDHIFLFSGDGVFRRLVEGVQRLGVRVTVISSVRATPMVADELRRQADGFIELLTIRDLIARRIV